MSWWRTRFWKRCVVHRPASLPRWVSCGELPTGLWGEKTKIKENNWFFKCSCEQCMHSSISASHSLYTTVCLATDCITDTRVETECTGKEKLYSTCCVIALPVQQSLQKILGPCRSLQEFHHGQYSSLRCR